jgi:16S rRNA (cytidine1402-2'-O)-methyltransferase
MNEAPAGARKDEHTRRSYAIGRDLHEVEPVTAGLHIVATPIGNLADITLRALATLAGVDLIACEDTRVTRRLLERYSIATPMTPYHEHNAAAARPKLLRRLVQGASVALVSDAGTPLVSDPGFKLVRAAQGAGCPVIVVPGPSAPVAALTVSGLPPDQFFFAGFLPPRQAARTARIRELARIRATLLLFETGPRIGATLADLAAELGDRDIALCRELTKLHEEVRRGSLAMMAQSLSGEELRGEIVIVVAPPPAAAEALADDEIDAMLRQALGRLSLKDAVDEVAQASDRPRREIYRRALALAKEPSGAASH